MSLPKHFCWTRFGTEAGETIDKILERKESERQRNGGIFLWGIGNAIGPSMRELLRLERKPEVVFSPIRSSPRREDVVPDTIVVWGAGRDLDGRPCQLPNWSIVTSGAASCARPYRHYALVCYSDIPLRVGTTPTNITTGALRNLLSDNKIGASQVTAVVRYHQEIPDLGTRYPVAIRTRLVAPFFIELCDPHLTARPTATNMAWFSSTFHCRDGGASFLSTPDN